MKNLPKLKIIEKGPKILDSEIITFENMLMVSLPNDYRNFLLSNNGGCPEPSMFFYKDHSSESRSSSVRIFLSLEKEGTNTLYEALTVYSGRIPQELIPIAYDSCGNLICLCISGLFFGYVYFWDHENEYEEYEVPGFKNIYNISSTFTSFLSSLY